MSNYCCQSEKRRKLFQFLPTLIGWQLKVANPVRQMKLMGEESSLVLVHTGQPLLSCLQDVSTHSSTQISTLHRSSGQIVTLISAEIKQIWTEIHHLVHNRRLYLSREQQPYIHLNANRVRVLGKLTWQMIWRCQSPDKLLSSCIKAQVYM